ncbi:M4 family metallopeptidase, partial [Pseudomonadales bacterium]|nr:M4 family metallopeptidase [Pseudomonadales bacterium]
MIRRKTKVLILCLCVASAFFIYKSFESGPKDTAYEVGAQTETEIKLLSSNRSLRSKNNFSLAAAKEKLYAKKRSLHSGNITWTEEIIKSGFEDHLKAKADIEERVKNNQNILATKFTQDVSSLSALNAQGLKPRIIRDKIGNVLAVGGTFSLTNPAQSNAKPTSKVISFLSKHPAIFSIGRNETLVSDGTSEFLGSGATIFRINRSYKGLPVWGKAIVVTADGNDVKTVTGNFRGIDQEVDVSKKLNSDEINELAKSNMVLSGYNDFDVLAYVEGIHFTTDIPHHSYLVTVQSKSKQWKLYFSTSTNNLISKIPLFYNARADSSGLDLNGDTQRFQSEKEGNDYFLEDSTFPVGSGFKVFDYNGLEPNFKRVKSLEADNGWDPAAVSAIANAKKSYNYFLSTHDRNSFDGKGAKLRAVVNKVTDSGGGWNNASWAGGIMTYGAAGNEYKNQAIALDIAVHEFTHGVIESTSNLTYENESGALNESFADFFGAMADRDDWYIGEDVYYGSRFDRSMKNPESMGQPSHYGDFIPAPNTEDGDWGGVHTNSGIQNKALYLIAEGLTNEGLGSSIGKGKTEQIAYKTLQKLASDSKIINSATVMLLEAEALHGEGSVEAAAVKKAWELVGVFQANLQSEVGGTESLSLATGDDVLVHLYPRDGTMDDLFEETYDVYVQNINQPFLGHISSLQVGAYNDVPALGSKPSPYTSERGFLWVDYIGVDNKVRSFMASTPIDYGDIVLNIEGLHANASSPNGSHSASVDVNSNKIWIYEYGVGSTIAEVVGPSYLQGESGESVSRIDSLSFNSTGTKIIFDFEITRTLPEGNNAQAITFWSIGIFNIQTKKFYYPFSSTNSDISLGYPRFSNIKADIITFDIIDWSDYEVDKKSSSSVVIYDLTSSKVLSEFSTNSGGGRESAWGIPSFVADDKAIAFQKQSDLATQMHQVSLNKEYSSIANTTVPLTPFQSGFGQAHRNAYLNVTSTLKTDKESIDFGSIKLGDTALSEFTIKNEGNREMEITSISMSSNVLSINLTNGVILSGQSKVFDLKVDSSLGRKGLFSGSVEVEHTADNKSLSLGVAAFFDIDTDSDGQLNSVDTDDDNDGVKDFRDAYPLISLGGLADFDSDGRPNDCDAQCQGLGMSADLDDDDDSMLDALEIANGLNPLDGTDCPR